MKQCTVVSANLCCVPASSQHTALAAVQPPSAAPHVMQLMSLVLECDSAGLTTCCTSRSCCIMYLGSRLSEAVCCCLSDAASAVRSEEGVHAN